MIKVLILAQNEEQAKQAGDWIVSGEVIGDKYEKKYDLGEVSVTIQAQLLWPEATIPKPSTEAIIAYCNDLSALPKLDSLMKFYTNVPVKYIVYDGVSESAEYETRWSAKPAKKEMPAEIVKNLYHAHNELVKLISKVFKAFDKDNSNFIELGEIKMVAKELGAELPESEVQMLMKELDTNLDGKISLTEFVQWWISGRMGKTYSMSDLVMRKIKKSKSLSIAADIMSQFGGIEELKAEEQKIESSNFAMHINKVAQAGFLLNISFMSIGKALSAEYQLFANAVNVSQTDPFIGIAFGCKNPKEVEGKLQMLYEAGTSMLGSMIPNFDMVQKMHTMVFGSTSNKAVLCATTSSESKAIVSMLLDRIRQLPAIKYPDQTFDFYLALSTDFAKIVTEDKPIHDCILDGISLEFKSQLLEKFSSMITAAGKNQATIKMLPHDMRQIAQGIVGGGQWFKSFKGELVFEVDSELRQMIKEKATETPFAVPLKDLKVMIVPKAQEMIEMIPLLKILHETFRDEVTSMEIFLYIGGAAGLKIYFDLPGLYEFLKLE